MMPATVSTPIAWDLFTYLVVETEAMLALLIGKL